MNSFLFGNLIFLPENRICKKQNFPLIKVNTTPNKYMILNHLLGLAQIFFSKEIEDFLRQQMVETFNQPVNKSRNYNYFIFLFQITD